MRDFLARTALAGWMALALLSCSTADEVFPPSASVLLTITDRGLASQFAATPGAQIARWSVREATITFQDVPAHSFLGPVACEYAISYAGGVPLSRACAGSGLVVDTGTRPGTLHLEITRMELYRAERPDLPAGGDYDGDGVPNGVDNCDLAPNPDQKDKNADNFGDACSIPASDPINPDRDVDGVSDLVDNCIWVANPAQTDTAGGGNGIGDDCELQVPVILPGGTFTLDETLDLTFLNGVATYVTVDFDERETLSCTPSFSSCTLDPDKVEVRLGL